MGEGCGEGGEGAGCSTEPDGNSCSGVSPPGSGVVLRVLSCKFWVIGLSDVSALLWGRWQALDEEFPERPLFPSDPALAAEGERLCTLSDQLSKSGYR